MTFGPQSDRRAITISGTDCPFEAESGDVNIGPKNV